MRQLQSAKTSGNAMRRIQNHTLRDMMMLHLHDLRLDVELVWELSYRLYEMRASGHEGTYIVGLQGNPGSLRSLGASMMGW